MKVPSFYNEVAGTWLMRISILSIAQVWCNDCLIPVKCCRVANPATNENGRWTPPAQLRNELVWTLLFREVLGWR